MNEENARNPTANQKKALRFRIIRQANTAIWINLEQPQLGLKQIENLNSFCASA
jgi:hypothetical protein